jgi:DNA-binding NarL/FixJ family response regulator
MKGVSSRRISVMNPQDQRNACNRVPADAGTDSRSAYRIRVLIVDNHELVRRGLAALVNAESDMHCCGEAPCDESAMDVVNSTQPDVVIIDVAVTRGIGLEIVQRIRKTNTRIRVIALAMTERPELVERSLSAGAVEFVSKNGLAARVLEAVRRSQLPRSAAPSEAAEVTTKRQNVRTGGRLDAVEREIVQLIGRGVPDRGIAIRLGLSVGMVEGYRRRIRSKLNCPTATQLVELCARWTAQMADRTEAGVNGVAAGARLVDEVSQ